MYPPFGETYLLNFCPLKHTNLSANLWIWEYLSVHILVEKLQSPTSMPLNAKENKSKAFLVKTVTTILNWQPPETHCLNYCQYLVTVWKCSLTPLHCVLPSSLLHKLWHIHKLQISFVFKTWIYSWSLSFHSILCIQIQILRTYEKSYFLYRHLDIDKSYHVLQHSYEAIKRTELYLSISASYSWCG